MKDPLIRSCLLLIADQSLFGDLYKEGSCYLFVGHIWVNGEIMWRKDRPIAAGQAAITIQDGAVYFEQRGVIGISSPFAMLNHAAKEYLR